MVYVQYDAYLFTDGLFLWAIAVCTGTHLQKRIYYLVHKLHIDSDVYFVW
jgi:hypothetical protein